MMARLCPALCAFTTTKVRHHAYQGRSPGFLTRGLIGSAALYTLSRTIGNLNRVETTKDKLNKTNEPDTEYLRFVETIHKSLLGLTEPEAAICAQRLLGLRTTFKAPQEAMFGAQSPSDIYNSVLSFASSVWNSFTMEQQE